jgi:hypothetical protein
MRWKTALAIARGPQHEEKGTPCQDAGVFEILPGNVLVGAVCDGAGSAAMAETGARLTAARVLACLRRVDWKPSPIFECEARSLFLIACEEALAELRATADATGNRLRDYNTTLLAFVLTPGWLAATQIGDGFLVAREDGKERYRLLFLPQHGDYANEAAFVTDPNMREEMEVCVVPRSVSFISASTDGLEWVALRPQTWTPNAPFFLRFETFMRETDAPEAAEAGIRAFFEDAKLRERHPDDKTLFLSVAEDSREIAGD